MVLRRQPKAIPKKYGRWAGVGCLASQIPTIWELLAITMLCRVGVGSRGNGIPTRKIELDC